MTVTFSEAVTVTGTPQIDLTIGSTVRQADYESGSTTTQLLFQYEVQVADEDNNGAAINENGLKLNSGRIFLLKNSVTVNADLAHSAVANQSRHKVDGVAPTLTEAEVKSDELTLAYVERIDAASKPATGDFAVTVDGDARGVTEVTMYTSEVALTLASEVGAGRDGGPGLHAGDQPDPRPRAEPRRRPQKPHSGQPDADRERLHPHRPGPQRDRQTGPCEHLRPSDIRTPGGDRLPLPVRREHPVAEGRRLRRAHRPGAP